MTEFWTLVFLVSALNGTIAQGGNGNAIPDTVNYLTFTSEADCRSALMALAKDAKINRAACFKGGKPVAPQVVP